MGLLRTEWNTSSSRGSQVSLKTMQGPGKAETALSTGAADALRGNEEGRDSGAEEIGHRHDSRFISTESAGGDVESSFLKTICKTPYELSSDDVFIPIFPHISGANCICMCLWQ
jgi:hypothetical protein